MSFTIKCNGCGEEAKLTESEHEFYRYKYWKSDNNSLDFKWGTSESFIECKKCKNSIEQES